MKQNLLNNLIYDDPIQYAWVLADLINFIQETFVEYFFLILEGAKLQNTLCEIKKIQHLSNSPFVRNLLPRE